MYRKAISLFILLAILFNMITSAGLSTVWGISYTDVANHWSVNFVTQLIDKEIIAGYEDGSFRPDDNIGVDEFIKLTISSLGYKLKNGKDYWASSYIDKAKELGIVESGEFDNYQRPIIRGEMARIIVRALGLEISSISNKEDLISKIPDYYDIKNAYKEHVLIAYGNYIITGYEDGSFKFNQNATRAESAVIITRMLKMKPQTDVDDSPVVVDAYNVFYVSNNGNDNNNGSIDSPFASIERARDAIRKIKEAGKFPQGGITVYLRGGEYRISDTIEFTSDDSGEKDSPVIYKSYPGEVARLTGGQTLDYNSFKPISKEMADKLLNPSAKNKVLEIDLKAQGITNYGELARRGYLIADDKLPQMELYIDGQRMQLSRWPNSEFVGIRDIVSSGKRSKEGVLGGAIFTIDYEQPTKWKTNITDIYVAGVLGPNYFYDYYPIGSIQPGQITLREGSVTEYYTKQFIRYENVFEELDTPGEYYVDRDKGILYLYPTENLNSNSDIRVSMLEKDMISISGTSFIRFKNLQMDTMRNRALVAKGSDSLIIKNCNIYGTGRGGISVTGVNCQIKNNHIYDIGATGISISGGDYEKIIPSNNLVENNHIHKVAQLERSYNSGITVGYRAVGVTVRHNEIHDTPHAAMFIYGPEHLVEYNNIYDVVKEFHDMDAIYLNVNQYPWERGVVIRQNFIHDFGKQMFTEKQINVSGIRTDNNGNGLNVVENVFYNIGYENSNQVRAVCAEGIDNVIKNNIFIDVAETYDGPNYYNPEGKWDTNSDSVKNIYNEYQHFVTEYGKKYPEILDFYDRHFSAAKESNIFEDNLIVNISMPLSTLNATPHPQGFRAAPELVKAKNNYVTTKDPGFVDYKAKNFALKSDSEVYEKIPDFKNIEFDKMGLIKGQKVGTYQ